MNLMTETGTQTPGFQAINHSGKYMTTRAGDSSSSKRLSEPPSGNTSSGGVDAKAARKVKKPVVKILKDDDETALPEKNKKSAKASSSTKPEFQPEKAKDAKPARKSMPPVKKEDPSTSGEESGSSSAMTTQRGHKQPEKSVSTRATSSATSPRFDPLGRAIKAIETVDVDALKKLVPDQVQPDAVSRNGRSLLKIARYKQQQLAEIIKYLESQTGEGVLPSRGWIEEDFGEHAYAPAKKVRVIEFYDKHSDYYEFTNFYQGERIELDGMSWKTAEHYFQAQKFGADFAHLIGKVWDQHTAREAYEVAASNKAYWRPDWQMVKIDVMRKILAAKFGQDEDLRKSLCGTGNAQLVEASPKDDFWGYGPDGKGKNMLGKLLMELRTELQDKM
jgi:ribA/ribD-fused uncharacterized protein